MTYELSCICGATIRVETDIKNVAEKDIKKWKKKHDKCGGKRNKK